MTQQQKTVVLTGASQGIGAGVLQGVLVFGCKVVASAGELHHD